MPLKKLTRKKERGTRTSTKSGKKGWEKRFLTALCKVPNVTTACRAARISQPTAYDKRKADPAFSAAWDAACNAGVEELEAEAWRRAHKGVTRPIWKTDDGHPVKVDNIQEYSDTLAIFLLKAHKPDKYREVVQNVLTGADGGQAVIIVRHAHEANSKPDGEAKADG